MGTSKTSAAHKKSEFKHEHKAHSKDPHASHSKAHGKHAANDHKSNGHKTNGHKTNNHKEPHKEQHKEHDDKTGTKKKVLSGIELLKQKLLGTAKKTDEKSASPKSGAHKSKEPTHTASDKNKKENQKAKGELSQHKNHEDSTHHSKSHEKSHEKHDKNNGKSPHKATDKQNNKKLEPGLKKTAAPKGHESELETVCREVACEGLAIAAGYCRLHYIKNWKKVKRKDLILRERKLNQYIEELVAKYPDKYIEAIRQDLASDKDFAKVIGDLDLDESVDDFDAEGESADSLIDNIKRDFEDEGEF